MRKRIQITIPLLTFAVVLILLNYVLYIGYVPTESMEPTIPSDSIIIGLKIFDNPEVGDIIIFKHEGINLVKRIYASSGDKLPDGNIVPDNCYYVIGDNATSSNDSRYWDYPYIFRKSIVAIHITNFN